MKTKRARVRVNKFFIIVLFCVFLVAIIKLVYVAVSPTVDNINLTEFAENRDIKKDTLYASRGKIYDASGNILAQNANSYTLVAYLSESRTTNANNPQHVVDKEATAKALSEVLDMDYDYALGRLKENAYQVEFGISGKNLSENKKVEIESLNLPGIGFISGTKRYYPNSRAASYIIGYAKKNDNGEIVGEMGIEGYYNETLKGTDGYTEYQQDAIGYSMKEIMREEPTSGSDIYLTIDTQIQLILEDSVKTIGENNSFDWFTISVVDAKTGAIVGSASSPNFDPNTLQGLTSYVNPLIGYVYEPGSTMKTYSWLAAMEYGVYDGSDTFMSGHTSVAGATIKDFNNNGWGEISYDTGYIYSSNVGATYLSKKIGAQNLTDFYKSLGFGSKTGIELPAEESGLIKIEYESGLATASFGQGGIMTTPIQHLQAMTILTNDGVELKPYIVQKIVDQDGNVTYEGKRTELGKKVSSASVDKMKELMYGVVYEGLSKAWQPNNVTLIGKTGTAQIASSRGGYLTGNQDYIRSFAGIFPYEDPEYIIFASVKRSSNGATPLSKAVVKAVESIANYANLTSTSSKAEETRIIELSSYISENIDRTVAEIEKLKLKPIVIGEGESIINQYPLKKNKVLEGSKVFLLTNDSEYLMVDMVGWSSSEVISFCNLIGLNYHFTGYGVVSSFNIEVGSVIDLTKTLEVTLSIA